MNRKAASCLVDCLEIAKALPKGHVTFSLKNGIGAISKFKSSSCVKLPIFQNPVVNIPILPCENIESAPDCATDS